MCVCGGFFHSLKKQTNFLPDRHYLYPEKHREAVGSKDCCSEPVFFVPLHEKQPKNYNKIYTEYKRHFNLEKLSLKAFSKCHLSVILQPLL